MLGGRGEQNRPPPARELGERAEQREHQNAGEEYELHVHTTRGGTIFFRTIAE